MRYKILYTCLLTVLFTVSCAEKQQDIIAVNVLLTLPEDIYNDAIILNAELLKEHPNNITLNDNFIPHITLLQCYVSSNDLSKIETALEGLHKTIASDTLLMDHLQFNKEKQESFASMGIAKSDWLMALHKKTIALLEPFIVQDGSQKSYIPNADQTPIDDFTLAYVPKFVTEHSYDNYNPHISLGVAETSLLDSLERHKFRVAKFKAPSIALYQMGAFGTAQKILWESK